MALESISYYSAGTNIIGAISAILGFASISLFPIFSKLEYIQLESFFKKGIYFNILISVIFAVLSFYFSSLIIDIIYGPSYAESAPIVQYLSILIIFLPLINIYNIYFISSKRTGIVARLLIFATFLEIILGYMFVLYGSSFGQFEAIVGISFATIITNISYLIGLEFFRRRYNSLNNALH